MSGKSESAWWGRVAGTSSGLQWGPYSGHTFRGNHYAAIVKSVVIFLSPIFFSFLAEKNK